ncbi:caltrin-like protein 2 [Oxyura jamaicensis]|uniref:caltrin-like protein 2 n=1 Tax=Oxyura jamaicensis TaxID=8884 RepID=UPI0015A555CA|nr:caltrin-like protein 2 [Oxyura jamaicensis]
MRSVAALLLLGMLIAWMELPAGTAWSCPRIRITCARPNPPNACDSNWQCPRHQKCCQGPCGRRCLSRPPNVPASHA